MKTKYSLVVSPSSCIHTLHVQAIHPTPYISYCSTCHLITSSSTSLVTHPSTLKHELTTCHTTLSVNAQVSLGPPTEPGQHVNVLLWLRVCGKHGIWQRSTTWWKQKPKLVSPISHIHWGFDCSCSTTRTCTCTLPPVGPQVENISS